MTEPAIKVSGLSKCYRLGTIGRHTLVEEFSYWMHRLRGRDPQAEMSRVGYSAREKRRIEAEAAGAQKFWALDNVSFDVQPGEVIGVIGRNGAGKSTLLKILTRITEPSKGEAELYGRVGSLLEVGTGFHPELTGRENIFMNGTILGMKKKEICANIDRIIDFSEISEFIDTPVKRYSSGMYVRLAFAVAAHLSPEILLVDEVLAVGDVGFQKKCLGKMSDVANEGRTILFVSHNMSAVSRLCSRCLLIDEGKVAMDGPTETVIQEYYDRIAKNTQCSVGDMDLREHPGRKKHFDNLVVLTRLRFLDNSGNTVEEVRCGQPVRIEISYKMMKNVSGDVQFGVALVDQAGNSVCCFSTGLTGHNPSLKESGRITCMVPELPLVPGRYALFPSCKAGGVWSDYIRDAMFVTVTGSDYYGVGRAPSSTEIGSVLLNHSWEDD